MRVYRQNFGLLRFTFLSLFISGSILVGSLSAQPPKADEAVRFYKLAMEAISLQTSASYQTAAERFGSARTLYKEIGDDLGEAKSLVGLGFVADNLGRRADALNYYQDSLVLFKKLKNTYWTARVLNNTARIYDDNGEPERALKIFQEALPLRRAAKDLNGEAVTLNSIGAVYAKKAEYQKALASYESAFEMRNSALAENDSSNIRGKAIILNNIGRIYDELGDEESALVYLNRSIVFRQEAKDRNGEAITLNNLGLVQLDLGNLEAAEDYFDRALLIIRELGISYREATTLSNRALVYLKRGSYETALRDFRKTLEYHRSIGSKGGEATALNNIGIALQRQKNIGAATSLNEALIISRQSSEKSLEAMTLNNLMNLWNESGNQRLAALYGKQSVNKYQEIRSSLHTIDEEARSKYLATVIDTYRALAEILIGLGQFSQAKQVLKMLKTEEYYDFVRRDSNEIKNLASKVGLTKREKELIERYKKIADRVSELSREFDTLEAEKRKASRSGARLGNTKNRRHKEISSELSDANAAFRLFLEKQLVDEIGKQKVREIEYDRSLQAKLRKWGKGTVAIYTVVSKDRYRVIMTTPTVQIDGKTEISAAELNNKIFKFREALQDLSSDPRVIGKELYDILLKPIEKDLKAAGAKTLVWSLDGTLRYIPVSALSPDGESYLIESYQNAVITAKTRDDISDMNSEWRALGLGVSEKSTVTNPVKIDQLIDFNAIPGSVKELESIVRDERGTNEKGLLTGRRYIDKDFTLTAFENALASETPGGQSKYSVVHLASHFRLGENWTDSFLLLGNNKLLTLEEISNSPTLNFGDVELVTLSACDTAFANDANGKEIDSLAEAIQTKSGKAVLATLWAVVDESTPLLMTEFYRLRKENPQMTKSEAMRKVQTDFVSGKLKPDDAYIDRLARAIETRSPGTVSKKFVFEKDRPFAHPYFWSPFVLIGNWR